MPISGSPCWSPARTHSCSNEQHSYTNVLTKWPPSVSWTKSFWLFMFIHIPSGCPAWWCTGAQAQYWIISSIIPCSCLMERFAPGYKECSEHSSISIRNTSCIKCCDYTWIVCVYTWDVFYTHLFWFDMFCIWAWTVLMLHCCIFNVI